VTRDGRIERNGTVGAKNLIVKYLAHVIVESPRRMGKKAARYQIGVRRVRVDLKKGLVLLLERHGWVLLLIEQTGHRNTYYTDAEGQYNHNGFSVWTEMIECPPLKLLQKSARQFQGFGVWVNPLV